MKALVWRVVTYTAVKAGHSESMTKHVLTPLRWKDWDCLDKEIVQGTMPGARRRVRPRTAWMDNIKTWTGLSVEESIRMTEHRDKWRKYVHEWCGLRTAKEQNAALAIMRKQWNLIGFLSVPYFKFSISRLQCTHVCEYTIIDQMAFLVICRYFSA